MPPDNNNADMLRAIGKLEGTLEAISKGLSQNMQDIRNDIRRSEDNVNSRMDRLESGINKRVDIVEARVTSLEDEDKRIIEKVAKTSALGGGIGGTIAAALIEVFKRIPM